MDAFSNQRALLLHLPKNEPINISFSDIQLEVKVGTFRKEKKRVLKGLNGSFKSGELTAIMGPSGAGKSSLLNILTGFYTQGMSGVLKSNDEMLRPGDRLSKRTSCYIMQDDHLNPLFTVIEIMMQSADLKIGASLPRKAKRLIIEDIMETLGLSQCKGTRCGLLSGGQKKRLSIALELIDNPPVMFLDEPTTGLDSSSTLQLVNMLKRLARGGRNIICTIHQPCASVFEMFDHVYVISEGQCTFQGSASNVVPFLQSVGLQCPQYHNPADFLLDVVTGEFGEFNEHLIQAAKDPSWRNSTIAKLNCRPNFEKKVEEDKQKTCVLISNPSEWGRISVLLKRTFLHLHRDWTASYLKLALHFLVSIVIGLTFQNAGHDANKTFSNLGYIMATIVYISYTAVIPATLKLPSEVKVLKKEQFNNWYKFRTYYLAFLMINVPIQMIFSLVYICISYYITHQILEWTRFLRFLLIAQLVVICSECFGLAFGFLTNPVNGVFIGSILLALLLVFAGFFVIIPHMPANIYYISYGGYMRYAFEAMVLSIYGYNRPTLECPTSEMYCHFRFPEKLLEEIGMKQGHFWLNVYALSGFIVLFGFISYFLLKAKIKSRTS